MRLRMRLRMRLQRAGCERQVFSSDAIAMIHEATVGAIRDIDRLGTACLKETHKKKRKLVEREVVAKVIAADAVGAS
jgi:type II secretory pathway predicted ATPase ExeA